MWQQLLLTFYGNFLSSTFFCFQSFQSPVHGDKSTEYWRQWGKQRWNVVPLLTGMCPLAQVTKLDSTWAPAEKKSHSEIPGDALCKPFIISPSRGCLSSNPGGGVQTHRTEQGFRNETPLFLSKATTFIPFICRIVRFMVITFNYSYLPCTSSVMTHFLMQSLSTVQQSD